MGFSWILWASMKNLNLWFNQSQKNLNRCQWQVQKRLHMVVVWRLQTGIFRFMMWFWSLCLMFNGISSCKKRIAHNNFVWGSKQLIFPSGNIWLLLPSRVLGHPMSSIYAFWWHAALRVTFNPGHRHSRMWPRKWDCETSHFYGAQVNISHRSEKWKYMKIRPWMRHVTKVHESDLVTCFWRPLSWAPYRTVLLYSPGKCDHILSFGNRPCGAWVSISVHWNCFNHVFFPVILLYHQKYTQFGAGNL